MEVSISVISASGGSRFDRHHVLVLAPRQAIGIASASWTRILIAFGHGPMRRSDFWFRSSVSAVRRRPRWDSRVGSLTYEQLSPCRSSAGAGFSRISFKTSLVWQRILRTVGYASQFSMQSSPPSISVMI